MNNWDKMRKKLKEYQDTIVIHFLENVVLRGISQDEDDYYYTYENLDGETFDVSAIAGFIPLKGKLDKSDYERIESWWNMNTSGNMVKSNYKIIRKGRNEFVIEGIVNSENQNIIFRELLELLEENPLSKFVIEVKDKESEKNLKEIIKEAVLES